MGTKKQELHGMLQLVDGGGVQATRARVNNKDQTVLALLALGLNLTAQHFTIDRGGSGRGDARIDFFESGACL